METWISKTKYVNFVPVFHRLFWKIVKQFGDNSWVDVQMGICSLINNKYFLLHGKSWSQIERFSFIGKFIEYDCIESSLMWSISSWKCRFSHTIRICYNIKIASVCIYTLFSEVL